MPLYNVHPIFTISFISPVPFTNKLGAKTVINSNNCIVSYHRSDILSFHFPFSAFTSYSGTFNDYLNDSLVTILFRKELLNLVLSLFFITKLLLRNRLSNRYTTLTIAVEYSREQQIISSNDF